MIMSPIIILSNALKRVHDILEMHFHGHYFHDNPHTVLIKLKKRTSVQKSSYTPFISPNAQSLRTELHFQFIRFAAATLLFAFTPSVGFPHFGECGLRNGAR